MNDNEQLRAVHLASKLTEYVKVIAPHEKESVLLISYALLYGIGISDYIISSCNTEEELQKFKESTKDKLKYLNEMTFCILYTKYTLIKLLISVYFQKNRKSIR